MPRVVLRTCALTVVLTVAAWPRSVVAAPEPVKAAVFRSQGTQFLGMTIWRELNAGWWAFGDIPVKIDYTSLAGTRITLSQLEATQADVIILSCPGYLTYRAEEIDALIDYVEAGHGLIITYGNFRSEDYRLAPLVGLSEEIVLGTGTAIDPFWIEPNEADHPIFEGVSDPYVSGVPFVANVVPYYDPWPLQGGVPIADLLNDVMVRRPAIITHDPGDYRGVYFSYYIEDKAGGTNRQDMQVFYNSLLWSANVPEPTSALLVTLGAWALGLRRGKR
jgi:hypothetical protein